MSQTIDSVEDADMGSIDPDIALLGDYLARDLSDEQVDALEQRLTTDPAFCEKAEPLFLLFGEGPDFRAMLARYQVELRGTEASAAPLISAALPINAAAPTTAPVATTEASRVRAAREPLRWHGWQVFPSRRSLWQMAAVLLIFGGVGVYKTASIIPVPASGLRDVLRVMAEPWAPPFAANAAEVRTQHGETKTITLPDSSVVELRSNSRLTWELSDRRAFGVRASLVGEAAIEVNPHERGLEITSTIGAVLLAPGSYAVRADMARDAMLVTVVKGHALLLGGTPSTVWLLSAGKFGWIHNRQPQATSGYQYPQPGARK
jgi:hypothetical protein